MNSEATWLDTPPHLRKQLRVTYWINKGCESHMNTVAKAWRLSKSLIVWLSMTIQWTGHDWINMSMMNMLLPDFSGSSMSLRDKKVMPESRQTLLKKIQKSQRRKENRTKMMCRRHLVMPWSPTAAYRVRFLLSHQRTQKEPPETMWFLETGQNSKNTCGCFIESRPLTINPITKLHLREGSVKS